MTAHEQLSDIEIVRLCAHASGVQLIDGIAVSNYRAVACTKRTEFYEYWPLDNKAQAMDLVIALRICFDSLEEDGVKTWCASWWPHIDSSECVSHEDVDPLRAICLCAARVQLAKEKQ